MSNLLSCVFAPAVSIGCPEETQNKTDVLTFCPPFVKTAAPYASSLPPSLLPSLPPPAPSLSFLSLSLQNKTWGVSRLKPLGVIRRRFLPFLLTGDYWGALVKEPPHNSNYFPLFFLSFYRGCSLWMGIISVRPPFCWNLEEIGKTHTWHLCNCPCNTPAASYRHPSRFSGFSFLKSETKKILLRSATSPLPTEARASAGFFIPIKHCSSKPHTDLHMQLEPERRATNEWNLQL